MTLDPQVIQALFAQFKEAAFGEVLRLIKEVEPPKPSTRVSSSAQLPHIAAQRSLDPAQLGRSIRGDLDWIVMKAIEKERERRYDTANGLARDIERFLNLEAVEACPPSTAYRLRRMARKHRALIGSAAAFSLVLILGTGLSVWQALRATYAESLASQRLVDVQAEQQKAQEALQLSQASERRALESESTAVAAREALEHAQSAEAEQRQLAEQQRDEATKKSNELEVLTEEQRRIIYVSEMNQVRIEAQRGNLARMREILLEQLPIDGKEDLRGFEWNYWYRYLNQAQVLNKFDKATIDTRGSALVTVLPGGRHVAWTQATTTELVDLQDGTSRRLPYQLRHYVDRTRFSHTGRAVVGACLSHTFPVSYSKPPGTDQGSSTSCSVIEPTGQVHTFDYPSDGFKHISALTISSDGSLVAVIGYDASHSQETPASRICIWHVDSKQLILNQVYPREINRFSFSPDGEKLSAHLCHGTRRKADESRDVGVIIDVDTGKEMAVLQHDDNVDSLFWVPGSDRVLLITLGFSGTNRRQLFTWQTTDAVARPVLLSKETMPDYVNGVVSPDGSTLAITSHVSNNIRLFDTTHGDLLDTLQTDGKAIVSLTFSADGRQIIATTVTGEVLQWDLGKSSDLFALRTKPLPRMATNGYSLSQDQSMLAIALADGGILIRKRDGVATTLKSNKPPAGAGSVILKVSPDNRLLAILSKFSPDAAPLTSGRGQLEVYDLALNERLWQTNCIVGPDAFSNFGSSFIEFTSDGEKLVQIGANSSKVFDAWTGKGTAFNLRENSSSQRPAFSLMCRNTATGALYAVTLEPASEGVEMFNVFDAVTGAKMYGCSVGQAGIPILAPDGKHCVNPRPNGVEVWDLSRGERVVTVPGMLAIFSPDSNRFAALVPNIKSKTQSLSGLAIWDLASRQQLCELPLAGNTIEEARFSPDGKRLLTLEGKRVSDSGGKIPRGRLWDVETGREILDLPVAEQSHYTWELFFDPSGHQLTQLLFDKTEGTTGSGKTAFYDARPLEPAVDNELAADRLMTFLTSRFALKREWIAEIESRSGLKPGIREAVLAKIRDSLADPEQIARLTGEIVGFNNRTAEEYQRAVIWAEELYRLEPNSVRSCTLLGAAYYRTGRLDDALQIVSPEPSAKTVPISDAGQDYALLRQALLALVYFRMGHKRDAQVAYEATDVLASPMREFYSIALYGEASLLIPKRLRPTAPEAITSENLKKSATALLAVSGTAGRELAKFPRGTGHRLVAYDGDRNQRLTQDELLGALRDMYRFGLKLSAMEDQYSVESQLEFLDEAIREAPRYLTLRFARAWIRATCLDSQVRDAAKALEETLAICEQTKYQDATYLEALAAAYAASDEFSSAVRWQTTATNLYNEYGILGSEEMLDAQSRLEAYKKHHLCSTKMPFPRDLVNGGLSSAYASRERDASAPYIAPDTVTQLRRIDGSGAAWSPDGSKIVRNIQSGESDKVLEWIDLASGQTQVVCADGLRPLWAAKPTEQIYFARSPQGVEPTPFNRTIWQCDPDGKNLKQLMEGIYHTMLKDGSLMVVVHASQTVPPKYVVKGYRSDQPGAWSERGLNFELQSIHSRLSPDGRLMAESGTELVIRDVVSQQTVQSLDLISHTLAIGTISGAWSPDSRFYVYGGSSRTSASPSGLWILDVTTGNNRLLADIDAIHPSWSHDGRFIAADERGKNKIVIMDVSAIYSEDGIGNAPQISLQQIRTTNSP